MSVKCLALPGLMMLIKTCLVVIVGQFTERQLWCQTTVKERKTQQEMLARVLRALSVALGRLIQRV